MSRWLHSIACTVMHMKMDCTCGNCTYKIKSRNTHFKLARRNMFALNDSFMLSYERLWLRVLQQLGPERTTAMVLEEKHS